MSKSYRIRTTPGEDNGYLKVNLDLSQNYDHLEILSLKISQKDEYNSYCAEYGVIAGRVIINNGFGVPNVRVSVFVPVEDGDLNDPVKSALYPYTEPFPDQKNKNGIRYNVLPSNQQKLDHTPVGTFPKKRQILDDSTTLEIYEKYYKYTTTTNSAGDYILFGVPVGDHYLHYDMDVSDIGFLSVRPFELIDQGYSDNLFKDRFKFKSSNNLDSLPQIFSQNLPIRVEPYWCDSLSVGSGLGINRLDISIDSLELVPTAIFMGSIFTDDEKDSLNKNCKPAREMGKLNEVITGPGKIEAIRRTVDGNIEKFTFKDNSIDDNGNWSVLVPMNIRKVVTDEFGNLIPSPDGIKGVSTEGDYRFRVSMDATSSDKKLRERAKYLVPNTNNNFNFREYGINELKNSTDFTLNQQLSTITDNTPYANDLTNQYNYLEEFYPFRWKKVYTVKQYIGRMQKIGGNNGDEARGFIGIKDILNGDGVNKFPTNRLDTNFNPLYTIICILLTLFGHIVGFLNGILNIINGLITAICNVKLPTGICSYSVKGGAVKTKFNAQVFLSNGWFTVQYDGNTGGSYIDEEWDGDNAGRPWVATPGCFDAKGECDNVSQVTSCSNDLRDCFNNTPGARLQAFTNNSNYPSVKWLAAAKVNGSSAYYYTPPNTVQNSANWKTLRLYQADSNTYYTNLKVYAPWNAPDVTTPGWTIGQSLPAGTQNTNGGTVTLTSQNAGFYSGDISSDGAYIMNQNVLLWNTSSNIIYENVNLRTFFYSNNPGTNGTGWYNEPSGIGNNNCYSCSIGDCQPGEVRILGKCWTLKNKCIFGQILCKKCKDICGGSQHSCCSDPSYNCPNNEATCGSSNDCCTKCCIKVPLIPLKCADEGKEYRLTLIKTPFGDNSECNAQYVKPYSCSNCGGLQTPGIKDWVSCVMEPVAVFLKMLKFDFYNDWVGGTLYFPLVKRNYKLKKRKRKFGQIKKDKFCDFDCREKVPLDAADIASLAFGPAGVFVGGLLGNDLVEYTNNFQGDPTFKQWRIKIPSNFFTPPTIVVNDCIAKVRSRKVTDWYGTNENDLQTPNLNLAVQELEFKGKNTNFEGCKIVFNNFLVFQNTFNSFGVQYVIKDRTIQGEHGKPEYVETEDADGNSTWTNIGGHGHHRNICDDTRMMERKEYFKTSLDCVDSSNYVPSEDEGQDGFGSITQPQLEDSETTYSNCDNYTCEPNCNTNGVAPCIGSTTEYDNFSKLIKHGLITWAEGSIYYTPYIPKSDVKYNNNEYKANLMLPTTIMELGSSTYCDIDDIPFIMDVIPPTTFNVSYEDVKYKLGTLQINGTTGNRYILKFEDKQDISLNLRSYVEFSCNKAICVNTSASVNHSQIGVDIIDKNDIGIEIGNCFLRFDHDEDIRSYFCKRFNGYQASNLTFHHQRPGSLEFDNVYNTYPEISLSDGFNLFYNIEGEQILSEYNDGDSFIPGDACGYKKTNGSGDYFYGLAPGQTSSFINYPNGTQTINFNEPAQLDGVDEINQLVTDPITGMVTLQVDTNNGSNLVNGIKFSRTQTPYFLYFGLVPGKTALHRTVSQFFADLIDAVTLEGLNASNDTVSENINNSPNINNTVDNPFTVYKTCLGETLIQTIQVGNTVPLTTSGVTNTTLLNG